jgi:hypothetical protein
LPASHDKLDEAHWFLHRTLEACHEPKPFRWNLNALLQAIRSIDHMLCTELAGTAAEAWYEAERDTFRTDPMLGAFKAGRDVVVHKGLLEQSSEVHAGLFRNRRLKLAIPLALPVEVPSSELLARLQAANESGGLFVDPEHSALGEELGIERVWTVPILGDGDVCALTHRAWARLHGLVQRGHELLGSSMPGVPPEPAGSHDPTQYALLTETDLDPTLPDQWGW